MYEVNNRPLWYIFIDNYINTQVFKKIEDQCFDQVSLDEKNVFTFE